MQGGLRMSEKYWGFEATNAWIFRVRQAKKCSRLDLLRAISEGPPHRCDVKAAREMYDKQMQTLDKQAEQVSILRNGGVM